jgi:hypothetical protein
MNWLLHHAWLAGLALALAGAILVFATGHFLAWLVCWLQLKRVVKSGRTITWGDVITRCRSEPVVVIVELRSCPQRIWFLRGGDETSFFSRKAHPRSKGLLVLGAPDAAQISVEVPRAGGRVAEVDMNATFW